MHMEKSLAASPLHSRFLLRLCSRVSVCLWRKWYLSFAHTHTLAAQWASNSISEMCLLDAGGTEARGWQWASCVVGEAANTSFLQIKEMHIHMTAKHWRSQYVYKLLFFIFTPKSQVNCKQRQYNSGSKLITKGISNFSTTLFQMTVPPYPGWFLPHQCIFRHPSLEENRILFFQQNFQWMLPRMEVL